MTEKEPERILVCSKHGIIPEDDALATDPERHWVTTSHDVCPECGEWLVDRTEGTMAHTLDTLRVELEQEREKLATAKQLVDACADDADYIEKLEKQVEKLEARLVDEGLVPSAYGN